MGRYFETEIPFMYNKNDLDRNLIVVVINKK